MDPALLRERERFKARSLQLPTVEKRKVREDDSSFKSRPHKKARPPPKPKGEFDYKSMSGASQYRFGILAKIVKHMKQRHQEGYTHPLTMDEILDETNQLDATQRQRHWLVTEALNNNPKIDVVEGDKYKFKPKYKLKDRKGLLRLLDRQDRDGLGGIFLDDVEESLPNSAKALKALGDQVTYVTRPDKKKVLFYNDKSYHFEVDTEIQKMWRSVAVDGIDEGKIEDYLQRQGITSMQDIEVARAPKQKRRGGRRNKKTFKSHNEHMAGVFQDYSEATKK